MPPAEAHPVKKGRDWTLPLFIVFMLICLGVGINYLYEEKRAVEWFISLLFRVVIPAGLAYILYSVFIKDK